MNTQDAITLTQLYLEKHDLLTNGWKVVVDERPLQRLGHCRHAKKEIGISLFHIKADTEDKVENTILHEIAHALVGPAHGHDYAWRICCRKIGCNAERLGETEAKLPYKYRLVCQGCGAESGFLRTPKRIQKYRCRLCCSAMVFDEKSITAIKKAKEKTAPRRRQQRWRRLGF